MLSKKQNVIKYSIELLIVAFGVFLGIFGSDWVAQRKVDNKVEKTINYITNEMEINNEKLKQAIAYHKELKKQLGVSLQKLSKEDLSIPYVENTKFKYHELPNWKGVGITQLKDVSFESAKISGVLQELDFATIQLISNVYQYQETYKNFSKPILNRFIEIYSDTKTSDVIASIEILTSDILEMEISIQQQLASSIEELGKQKE